MENGESAVETFSVSREPNDEDKIQDKKTFFAMDRETVRVKLHFFLYVGTAAMILPFMPVIASKQIGLSGTSLGLILTFQNILFIFVNPLIGFVTDYFNKLKAMICIFVFLFALPLTTLLAIPPITYLHRNDTRIDVIACQLHELYENKSHDVINYNYNDIPKRSAMISRETSITEIVKNESAHSKFMCAEDPDFFLENFSLTSEDFDCKIKDAEISQQEPHSNYTMSNYIRIEITKFASNSSIFCCRTLNLYHIVSCDTSLKDKKVKIYQFGVFQFWAVGLCIVMFLTAQNSLRTLSDTACCEIVERKKSDFGRLRLYWSLGFGIMTIISGILHDYTGGYVAAYAVMWVFSAISLWNICMLDLAKPKLRKGITEHIGSVMKSPEFLVFLFGVLLYGIDRSISGFYYVLFLTNIGASHILFALVISLERFLEIPVMFKSTWVIEKIGNIYVLPLCIFMCSLRHLCLSYLHNPWLAFPIELFQSFTNGLFFPTISSYAKIKSKPGTEATMQAIVANAYEGIVGFGGSYQYRRCDIDDSKSIPPYKWRCYYSDREDSARCFVSCNYQPETEHNCLNAGRFRPTLPYCVKQNP